MILSDRQREMVRWYWEENRTISEIADWLECSYDSVKQELKTLRAIYRSHGQELPKFNRGRERGIPDNVGAV